MVCVKVLPPEPGVDIKIAHFPSWYVSPNLARRRMIFPKMRVGFMPLE
jgi:hypothetical protein